MMMSDLDNDIKTGLELLKEDFIMKNPKWMKELEIMVSRETVKEPTVSHTLFQHTSLTVINCDYIRRINFQR